MSHQHIPKVELHCHLDGIVDPSILRAMQRDGLEPAISPETLEGLYPIEDFGSFVRWGSVVDEALEGDMDAFRPILATHLERLKSQNVVYSEIMLPSSELPRDRSELLYRVRAFRNWVRTIEDGQVQVEFLVGILRSRTPEFVEELAEMILLLYQAGLIVGVALAGPEQGNPVEPFQRTFHRFHEAGLGIEIHAGEWCGPESVWDALEHGFPDRIGHGVAVFADPRLLRHVQEERVHLEMCPTSNVRTGSVRRIEEHPVWLAKEMGLSFSINTDDPGAFECSMESEFQLVSDLFGFRHEHFEKIKRDALEARFQPVLRHRVVG